MAAALKLGFVPFTSWHGVLILFCGENLKFGPASRRIVSRMGETLRRAAAADRFTGKSGSSLDVIAPAGLEVPRLVVVGTGKDTAPSSRDLVNEPGNVLYPGEFARRASALSKLGVVVEVLDTAAMRKLGMGALLGVGQGSAHEARLVVMRWNGGKRGADPVAFIGKGVCFDSGGISIKPAQNMEDMKGDMAGAACVVGLMHTLAARKAKVNAVGAIGLVENMPDGKAQRPGDIVKTMSGQTIEIINTDAEGRRSEEHTSELQSHLKS